MATFYTDADRAGSGEFVEAQVSLATEFTLPAGTISRFRWPFPAVAPSASPAIRLYNAAGTLLASVPFDTSAASAWNWATPGSPISVAAGTYRATVATTRYPAKTGFFTAGSVTRGDITAVRGRFTSGDAAPTSMSTASYLVDVDFTASAGGSTVNPDGVAVPVAVGAPTLSWSGSIAPGGVTVPVTLGGPALGAAGLAPAGVAVPVALAGPTLVWSATVAPDGIFAAVTLGSPGVGSAGLAPDGAVVPVAVGDPVVVWSAVVAPGGVAVPVTVGGPSAVMPGQRVTRPNTGMVVRPNTGLVARPNTGVVVRPNTGLVARPNTGVVVRP